MEQHPFLVNTLATMIVMIVLSEMSEILILRPILSLFGFGRLGPVAGASSTLHFLSRLTVSCRLGRRMGTAHVLRGSHSQG